MMTNNYDRFISNNRKSQPTANCWSCSNVVLFRSSPSVPLVLLWLSYGALKWVRSAFLDEPSGQAEREEGSKVMP